MDLSNNPFKRPFPDREFGREVVVGIGRVSIFVFAALYFLRPAGIHFPNNPLLICLGYGIVTFLVGVGYSFVTTKVFGWKKSGDGWTLGRWILDAALLLVLIALANFIYYNALVGWTAFHLAVLTYVAVPTVLIGLFPITFSGMAVQMRAERENRKTAGEVQLATARQSRQHEAELIPLGDGALLVDPNSLLFCESRQNYVRCVFLKDGQSVEQTIRATLTSLAEQVTGGQLIRCHRSYLVNPEHVRQAQGNAQGLRLELVATNEEVPVSRAYVTTFRELMLNR